MQDEEKNKQRWVDPHADKEPEQEPADQRDPTNPGVTIREGDLAPGEREKLDAIKPEPDKPVFLGTISKKGFQPATEADKDRPIPDRLISPYDEIPMGSPAPSQLPGGTIGRKMTFGEMLVGINFNPSNDQDVDEVKRLCARIADIVESKSKERETTQPYLTNTLYGDAVRNILHAQMAAVKYLTWKL